VWTLPSNCISYETSLGLYIHAYSSTIYRTFANDVNNDCLPLHLCRSEAKAHLVDNNRLNEPEKAESRGKPGRIGTGSHSLPNDGR
jgi:hypothetical protein